MGTSNKKLKNTLLLYEGLLNYIAKLQNCIALFQNDFNMNIL